MATRPPKPGDRTRVTNEAPGALPLAERHHGRAHWCQPLPYSLAGSIVDVCGYCGAPLERAAAGDVSDRGDAGADTAATEWHYWRVDLSFGDAARRALEVERTAELRIAERARLDAWRAEHPEIVAAYAKVGLTRPDQDDDEEDDDAVPDVTD